MSKEKLDDLKEKVTKLQEELEKLTPEELEQVFGGIGGAVSTLQLAGNFTAEGELCF